LKKEILSDDFKKRKIFWKNIAENFLENFPPHITNNNLSEHEVNSHWGRYCVSIGTWFLQGRGKDKGSCKPQAVWPRKLQDCYVLSDHFQLQKLSKVYAFNFLSCI
jgi:hypothetical protein